MGTKISELSDMVTPFDNTEEFVGIQDGATLKINSVDLISQFIAAMKLDPDFLAKISTNTAAALTSLQLIGGAADDGTMSWNAADSTIDVRQGNVTLQVGQEAHIVCRNGSGTSIGEGVLVMATGAHNSGRLLIDVFDGTDVANAPLLVGMTTETIANNSHGKVTVFGNVNQLDTSLFTGGDVLYASAAADGSLTNVKPDSLEMPVAVCLRSHNTDGAVLVRAISVNLQHPTSNPIYRTAVFPASPAISDFAAAKTALGLIGDTRFYIRDSANAKFYTVVYDSVNDEYWVDDHLAVVV